MFLSWCEWWVRRQFPGTPSITTDELQDILDSSTPPQGPHGQSLSHHLILDARGPEEFAVSHLPGAIRVDFNLEPAALATFLLNQAPEGAFQVQCVCYCSVGYRSAILTRAINDPATLTSDRFRALNVQGSVFKWAVEGRDLRDSNDQPVPYVHPYNRTFGLAVPRSLWRWTP
ncbi:uncharacterized protein LOC131887857 [Tigriopus californicus]|uniref:uncharacterized protein LOC131887857 n=1 Tax=Tigriopus californicus TaxID=6832 RepID=UPI0027DA207F|nr:uncharacterized protein LOC131887857 [Tigriopus californicus]